MHAAGGSLMSHLAVGSVTSSLRRPEHNAETTSESAAAVCDVYVLCHDAVVGAPEWKVYPNRTHGVAGVTLTEREIVQTKRKVRHVLRKVRYGNATVHRIDEPEPSDRCCSHRGRVHNAEGWQRLAAAVELRPAVESLYS